MGALHAWVAHVPEVAIEVAALVLHIGVGSALAEVAHCRDQEKTVDNKAPNKGPE